jgi:cytidylate kinase
LNKKITIAIDGFSSTGKSTKQTTAHNLGYVYVDTGAMYRAIALFAMQRGYIAAEYFDKESLINSLPTMDSIQIQSNWALPKCI